MKLLPIKFEYRGSGYEALVRIKVKETKTEYHITVMNGELEKMLYGHHVIIDENGRLQTGSVPDAETAYLKNKIAEALNGYIRPAPVSPKI
jgi:hypothetical protein